MVAMEMEALLAHRGALVHVNHSHRIGGYARTGARPSVPRGHQEVATATGPATNYLADLGMIAWDAIIDQINTGHCKNMQELCNNIESISKEMKQVSPCKLPEFWKDQCTRRGWIWLDPNYHPFAKGDPEGLDRWKKQFEIFCLFHTPNS
tara:strand:+ start:6216 stop:6665 length:450 start_codon:yes stop_codon:yes gene_type:complete